MYIKFLALISNQMAPKQNRPAGMSRAVNPVHNPRMPEKQRAAPFAP